MRRQEAGLGQAKRRGRLASCREGFEGGLKCLTLFSEKPIRREEAGLPAGEKGLGAVQKAERCWQACQLPRGVWGRSTMLNVAFGSP